MSPIGTMPPLDQLHKMIEFHPDPQHYQLLTIIGAVNIKHFGFVKVTLESVKYGRGHGIGKMNNYIHSIK